MNCGRFDCKIKGQCTTQCRLYEKLEGDFVKCRHWRGTCFGTNCIEFNECKSVERMKKGVETMPIDNLAKIFLNEMKGENR